MKKNLLMLLFLITLLIPQFVDALTGEITINCDSLILNAGEKNNLYGYW